MNYMAVTVTTGMGVAAFMSMSIAVIIIIARALKVSKPTLTSSCWARWCRWRRRVVPRDIGVPLIVIVIAVPFIVNVIT